MRQRTGAHATEVSYLLSCGRHGLLRQRGATLLTSPFFTPEEEHCVFPHGPGERDAEILIFQGGLVKQFGLCVLGGMAFHFTFIWRIAEPAPAVCDAAAAADDLTSLDYSPSYGAART